MDKKKKKKSNKRILIPLLLIIILLIIGILLTVYWKRQGEDQKTLQQISSDEEGKYVTVLENGAKQNNSEKLREDKKIDNLDFTQIELIEKRRNNTINRNHY